MPYKNRAAALARHKRYYEAHKEEARIRARLYHQKYGYSLHRLHPHGPKTENDKKRQKNLRLAVREFLINLKESSPCTDCQLFWPAEVMDWHHVRGEKDRNVSSMYGWSRAHILAEIAKCDLVCANCHRIRHLEMRIQQHS